MLFLLRIVKNVNVNTSFSSFFWPCNFWLGLRIHFSIPYLPFVLKHKASNLSFGIFIVLIRWNVILWLGKRKNSSDRDVWEKQLRDSCTVTSLMNNRIPLDCFWMTLSNDFIDLVTICIFVSVSGVEIETRVNNLKLGKTINKKKEIANICKTATYNITSYRVWLFVLTEFLKWFGFKLLLFATDS